MFLFHSFDFRDAIDVGQHRGAHTKPAPKQRSEVDEEPSMYKGYTNPNVQSRSFKILQQSLNYSEAPQGNHHLNNNDLQEEGGFGYCTNVAPTLIVKRAKGKNVSKFSVVFCLCVIQLSLIIE